MSLFTGWRTDLRGAREDVGRPIKRLLQVSKQETVLDWPWGDRDRGSALGDFKVKPWLLCDGLDAESKGEDLGKNDW